MHAKCTRCGVVGHRHGGRRRRCPVCGKTWSVGSARRGRKPRRIDRGLPARLLARPAAIESLAAAARRSPASIRRYCRTACRQLVAASALPHLPELADQRLVLIADGLWCRFGGRCWVCYNLAVKPVQLPVAFFLDPVLTPGREDAAGWQQALASIPVDVNRRIRGIVADGFRGSKLVARERGWVLQRCHRHLDVLLRGSTGRRKRRLRGGEVRGKIIAAVREARTTPDPKRVAELRSLLREQAAYPDLTVRIRGAVRRFLHDLEHYRAYLNYPDLALPVTTNAVESRNSRLRDVLRCINSPEAALLRLRTYTRLHPTIRCNCPKIPQN